MRKSLLLLVIFLLGSLPTFAQVVDTAWVRRYNGPGNGTDYAYAISVDGSGNVYVTGSSLGSGTSYDYATIKYDFNGDTAWVRRYNGPWDGKDRAHDLVVDESGNVYVTGDSYSGETVIDYATIKYYSNGDTAWVRRYIGPGFITNTAHALAVDGSGNVYVTGWSVGSGTFFDYATIKYNSNGDTAWVRRYDGPGNSDDKAYALAVDGSGNVYVTGESEGSGTSYDYATIKYDSNGDTAWVRRYDGPGNGWDKAHALALDGSGNVYITGRSMGSGTSYDYATIKYDFNGDTAWVRRYIGPADWDEALAIVVDGSGNVYVTGYSHDIGTNGDYTTIKYDSNGDTVWVMRYNGSGNSLDVAEALTVDSSGNVYVTGGSDGTGEYNYDFVTIKYVELSSFVCGDVNHDWSINLSDPICLANYCFGKPCSILPQASDVNCDSNVNLADAIIIAKYFFGIPGFELNCCE